MDTRIPVGIVPLQLDRGIIRMREDGYVNILDMQALIPGNLSDEKSWRHFWSPSGYTGEVMSGLAQKLGIPHEDMIQAEYADTSTGERRYIWVQLDLALEYAAFIDPRLRADMVITYRRAMMGDVTLAAEIAERNTDSRDLKWLKTRLELSTHTPIRNSKIHEHGGRDWIYGYCAEGLNVASTGLKSQQIQKIAGVNRNHTRDALDTSHLAMQLLGESEQIKAMDRENARGNQAIKESVEPVHEIIGDFSKKLGLHDEHLIFDRTKIIKKADLEEIPVRSASPTVSSTGSDSPIAYPCRDFRHPAELHDGFSSSEVSD